MSPLGSWAQARRLLNLPLVLPSCSIEGLCSCVSGSVGRPCPHGPLSLFLWSLFVFCPLGIPKKSGVDDAHCLQHCYSFSLKAPLLILRGTGVKGAELSVSLGRASIGTEYGAVPSRLTLTPTH